MFLHGTSILFKVRWLQRRHCLLFTSQLTGLRCHITDWMWCFRANVHVYCLFHHMVHGTQGDSKYVRKISEAIIREIILIFLTEETNYLKNRAYLFLSILLMMN